MTNSRDRVMGLVDMVLELRDRLEAMTDACIELRGELEALKASRDAQEGEKR